MAERIAWGVQAIERSGGWCAWLVLTWPQDVAKPVAVRQVNGFVKWLRGRLPGLAVAKTWELTKAGRLHCNLIAGPWAFVPQAELQRRWGSLVWVERVRDDVAVGREVSKAYSPGSLGGYLLKLEQAVPTDRRVGFSRNWPQVPGSPVRRGLVQWELADTVTEVGFHLDLRAGLLVELRPGEWARVRDVPWCRCFDLVMSCGP